MKKKLTLLFALLCASVMGWAEQYCERVVTTTIDYTSLDVTVTVKKQDANTVRVILDVLEEPSNNGEMVSGKIKMMQ